MTSADCPESGALTELAAEGVDPSNVLAHLAACDACRKRYDEIRAILAGLDLLVASSGNAPDAPRTRPVPPVIGKYFIIGKTGEGPGTMTLRAVQPHLDPNEFAIVLAHEPWSDPDVLQPCFEAACGPLGSLDHPSIAPAEDLGLFEDRPFIVYRHVDGEPLTRVLAQGPMARRDASKFADGLAGGLAYAQQTGMVHGGLTIDGVRIDREGRAVITDFAASRLLLDPAARPDRSADLAALKTILDRIGVRHPAATDVGELARKLERKGRFPWNWS